MSTSPSWFDQDKFSRLVKKVGPKAAPAAGGSPLPPRNAPRPPVAGKEGSRVLKPAEPVAPPASSAPPLVESAAKKSQPLVRPSPAAQVPAPPVAQIPAPPPEAAPHDPIIRADPPEASKEAESFPLPPVFPAPLPVPEPRSVSPLLRRTTPLPDLKSIFEYDKPSSRMPTQSQPLPNRPILTPPTPIPPPSLVEMPEPPNGSAEARQGERSAPVPTPPESLPEGAGTIVSLPPDETLPAFPKEEAADESREEEDGEGEEDLMRQRDELIARVEELSGAAEERDDARNEVNLLRAQLLQAEGATPSSGLPDLEMEELSRAIDERDSARRDYANLRQQFETLKKEQGRARIDESGGHPGLSESVEALQVRLAERDEEINSLKISAIGLEDVVETLKQELNAVQGQINQSRDEASIAQRGLALSQKALQETRDALREASEGSSQNRTSLESLKHECSTLVQQNMALQAQYDQLSRELNSAKSKLSTRGLE